MDVEAAGDGGEGVAAGEEGADVGFVAVELEAGVAATAGAAQGDSGGAEAGQGFAGALADEVALDLGRQAKGEGQDLALDVIAQPIALADGPDAAAFGHAQAKDFHDHEEAAAQAGELGAEDDVTGANALEECAQLALAVSLCATDGFLNPSVDGKLMRRTKANNLKPLIFNGLLVAANANVTEYHRIMPVKV